MMLSFDLTNVTITQFGVARDDGDDQTFVTVPIDANVQAALLEMVQKTWNTLEKNEDGPAMYEPSERHGAIEYLTLPLEDDLASFVRELHNATNLPVNSSALEDPSDVFCYFVRLTDNKKRRLTAIHRAAQFKGVLKKRLIRFFSDSLQLIDDSVFKLDSDFDLLIDSSTIHILRPAGFEFAGNLKQAILDAVPKNIDAIAKDLLFVEFGCIGEYARQHPRAARCLASIRGQAETKDISKELLKQRCSETGIEVTETDGKIVVTSGYEMAFLEVLDRRRYSVNLVMEKPEQYRAVSRKKLNA